MENRLILYPSTNPNVEILKSTGREGQVIEALLEYKEQILKFSNYSYNVFIGTTAGKKGHPNQDFAASIQKKLIIEDKEYDSLLLMVADGVSSKKFSEQTSKAIIKNTVDSFIKTTESYSSLKVLSKKLWNWIAESAQSAPAPHGVSTISLFLFMATQDETKGIAINCGDSRIYWATPKYVETAKVHVELLNPRNAISYALGADRINKEIQHDVYFIDNPVEIFLCTDTFAYAFDGVHVPEEMIPTFGRSLSTLNDHLTAISVKRI